LTNGNCAYVIAGPGLTEFTQGLANNLYIAEGTTRLIAARNYTEGTLYLFGNGVLEIGADLNGSSDGDFTRNVSFGSGGGFSAYGADRTVNIGGAGATFTWPQDGKPLIFSSPFANATLIFANPIDLATRTREFRVQNGSATIDASLTGKISGTKYSAVVKSGSGTLELKGPQDYRGDFSVIGGSLRLGANNVFAGGTNALVLSGATLDAGTYTNSFNTLELLTNSVIETGDGSAALAFADSSAKTWTGTLAVNGKLAATTLRFGTDNKGLTAAQIASIAKSGGSLYLDAQGYLRQTPMGTILFLD
jgi:autotransporter-associated beta strand protein